MKDSKGHGSNGRGGSGRKTFVMPSRPYRQSDENTAHQRAIADQHGVSTDHLAGKRAAYEARGRVNSSADYASGAAYHPPFKGY
jgi:hypothetical protein